MMKCLILTLMLASLPTLAAELDNSKAGFEALRQGDQKGFFDHALVDAQDGMPEAQVLVGQAYQNGTFGVAVNIPEAIRWYEKAAEQHQKDAETALGLIYGDGAGVPKDLATADKWLLQAMSDGSGTAADYLGDSYLTGRGVDKDAARALQCYTQAARENVMNAQIKLAGIYYANTSLPQNFEQAYYWSAVAQYNPDRACYPQLDAVASRAAAKLPAGMKDRIDAQIAATMAARAEPATP